MVKGTNIGTITDLDGNFSLDVPEKNKILQISYVGMTMQEVAVKPHVTVVLQSDVKNLEEVVVTAMGLNREKKSPYKEEKHGNNKSFFHTTHLF